jgi:RNA polymerase sigma-70 factor (ECF subfamily)
VSRDLDEHLSAIAEGDAEAFGLWMAGGETPLRSSLARFASQLDVEAVLQETLLRVWQVAPRFEPDGRANGLLRLAFRIARNLALDELRRLRARPTDFDALERAMAAAEQAAQPLEPDPALRRIIEGCRRALPRKPASALAARLASGVARADSELASELGMRLNTFLQNITRARRLLQACLERQGVDLEAWLT